MHARVNDCRIPYFECAVFLISFMDVVGCILPSRSTQSVELHLLLPNPLHALLYCFGDCALTQPGVRGSPLTSDNGTCFDLMNTYHGVTLGLVTSYA